MEEGRCCQDKYIIPKICAPLGPISGRIRFVSDAANRILVYQKPTCSKCRSTIEILTERGADFEAINYYDVPLESGKLAELISKLGIAARDLVRKEEQIYRDLRLGERELSDEELVELMVKHPDLIQRPIVVRGNKAILGRPPENVEELL